MHRTTALLVLALSIAMPAAAAASPAASSRPSPSWGLRALVVQPNEGLPTELGMAVDVRIRRGSFAPQVGASFAKSPSTSAGGHIRAEATFNYYLGPVYIGAGSAIGTLGIETPGVGSGKWAGSAVAFHGQIGSALPLGDGGRALAIELRAGHTLPIGGFDPFAETPDTAARMELSGSVGIAF